MDRRFYTPREVSEILRVSPTTVMKLIHEHRLYAVQVSERIYRVPVAALARMQSQASAPAVSRRVVDRLTPLGEAVGADEAIAAEPAGV